jgi:subtilisin family serine protease
MNTIYVQKTAIFAAQISLRMWFTTFAALLICTISFSQDTQYLSRVWVTIDDPSILQSTPASPFDQLMREQSVSSVKKAFPNAHTPSLQQVYELSCACDNTELEKLLLTIEGVSQPIAVYDPIMLDTPDDYSLTFAPDYALDLIHAQGAWEYTHGNSSVILGISDINFDVTHEELVGKIAAGGSTGPSSPYHGTAVAVTAAGNTNNSVGKSAIGYDCNLGLFIGNYNGLLAARDNGARVVNASWHDGSCGFNAYCQAIITELYEDGVVVIAAAGNGAATCGSAGALAYPASYNHVISVTSVGPNDNHEGIIGDPASAHQHNVAVDIAAPGYNVPLTVASGWYLTGNGSSFAAPFVTGTVGLMLSVNPDLTVDQIETILKSTAVNIDAVNPAYAGLLGAGRLNAEMAVALSSQGARPQPTTGNTVVFNQEGVIDNTDNTEIAGIEDNGAYPEPVIYPNPSAGNVSVSFPFKQGQSIEITDMTGRTEQLISAEGTETIIRLQDLATGVHYIILKEAGQVVFQRKAVIL